MGDERKTTIRITDMQRQMLHDLSLTDEPNSWAQFDPPFPQRTSDALLRKGLIEMKDGDMFRLTQAGLEVLANG